MKFDDSDFVKSSYSEGEAYCVTVAQRSGVVALRNSKDDSKTTLVFSREEWSAFIDGVKNGQFELK